MHDNPDARPAASVTQTAAEVTGSMVGATIPTGPAAAPVAVTQSFGTVTGAVVGVAVTPATLPAPTLHFTRTCMVITDGATMRRCHANVDDTGRCGSGHYPSNDQTHVSCAACGTRLCAVGAEDPCAGCCECRPGSCPGVPDDELPEVRINPARDHVSVDRGNVIGLEAIGWQTYSLDEERTPLRLDDATVATWTRYAPTDPAAGDALPQVRVRADVEYVAVRRPGAVAWQVYPIAHTLHEPMHLDRDAVADWTSYTPAPNTPTQTAPAAPAAGTVLAPNTGVGMDDRPAWADGPRLVFRLPDGSIRVQTGTLHATPGVGLSFTDLLEADALHLARMIVSACGAAPLPTAAPSVELPEPDVEDDGRAYWSTIAGDVLADGTGRDKRVSLREVPEFCTPDSARGLARVLDAAADYADGV